MKAKWTFTLFHLLGIIGGFLMSSAHACAQAPVLDQYNGPGGSVFGEAPTDNWQQGLTAGVSGSLSSISLLSFSGPATFTVYIDPGSPWQSGPNVFETQVTRPWGTEWFNIDLSAANIHLNQGEHFVIGVLGEADLYGSDTTYHVGALWFRNGDNTPTPWTGDLAFATYMVPVPEPSILALSLLALGASWPRTPAAPFRPLSGHNPFSAFQRFSLCLSHLSCSISWLRNQRPSAI